LNNKIIFIFHFRWVVRFKSNRRIANHEQVIYSLVLFLFISIERIVSLLVDIILMKSYTVTVTHTHTCAYTSVVKRLLLMRESIRKWGGINRSLFLKKLQILPLLFYFFLPMIIIFFD
jgi:hypothetical protein